LISISKSSLETWGSSEVVPSSVLFSFSILLVEICPKRWGEPEHRTLFQYLWPPTLNYLSKSHNKVWESLNDQMVFGIEIVGIWLMVWSSHFIRQTTEVARGASFTQCYHTAISQSSRVLHTWMEIIPDPSIYHQAQSSHQLWVFLYHWVRMSLWNKLSGGRSIFCPLGLEQKGKVLCNNLKSIQSLQINQKTGSFRHDKN
jgi:hypothetical protein